MEASLGSLGIVTGYLYKGNIMNSYSCNNTVNKKTTHNGGISGYAQNSTITNCYTYANQNVKGQVIGTGEKANALNCYCEQKPVINDDKDCTTKGNYRYTSSFTATSNNTPIYQLLNQWVESQETNSSIYLHWKADSTLPAVFVTP